MSDVLVTLGQRLKAEREKKGLSAQKAADELNLDGWVVDALESGDYARVGPAVYAKGHLKRYAVLLGLPVAEILEAYDTQSAPTPLSQPSTMRMRTSAPTGSELPWIQILGFAVVALVVAGLMWWKPWHLLGTSGAPVAEVPAQAPASAAEAPDVQGGNEAASATVTDDTPGAGGSSESGSSTASARTAAPGTAATSTAATSMAAASTAVPSTAAASTAHSAGEAPAPGAGRARLRLSFSADSWVDVHDATGQRVYAGNGRANSVKTITGVAPLRVYLKSASGVQLQINDRAVAIGPQFFAGDVARFEAGADGVLRRESPASRDTPTNRPRG